MNRHCSHPDYVVELVESSLLTVKMIGSEHRISMCVLLLTAV